MTMVPITNADLPKLPEDYECPLLDFSTLLSGILTFGIPVALELLQAAFFYYQLLEQLDRWKDDIAYLEILTDCYLDEAECYKDAKLELREKDQPVADFQCSLPSYPGPCDARMKQGRLNSMIEINREHKQALLSIPSWACGAKEKADVEAIKAEVKSGMHDIAESRNYEHNQVDRYAQLRLSGISRSVGGFTPSVSGAFSTVSSIAIDNQRRSAGALNSALGAFGNSVASIYNRFADSDDQQRFANLNSRLNTNTNNNTQVVNNNTQVINNNTPTETFSRSSDSGIRRETFDAFTDPNN